MTRRKIYLKMLLEKEGMINHADILLGRLGFPAHREIILQLGENELRDVVTVLYLYNLYREQYRAGVSSPFVFKANSLYRENLNLGFINEIQREILEEGISSLPEWRRFLKNKFNPKTVRKDSIIRLKEKIKNLEKRVKILEEKLLLKNTAPNPIKKTPTVIINKTNNNRKRGGIAFNRRYKY